VPFSLDAITKAKSQLLRVFLVAEALPRGSSNALAVHPHEKSGIKIKTTGLRYEASG